ncbi:MAG TPA: alpha/beta fold hydrolase [Solimonas sp.]|nr:alpha/beta fold hydrolase [Solimonas sp.]
MHHIRANGLQLSYETFGSAKHPALLLIMGLGGQLVMWPDSFCEALARGGYYVIRYDNRDIGLSDKLDHLGKPDIKRAGVMFTLGLPVKAPYLIDDMAADAVGLLDALKIKTAHVVGLSMGGMIGQVLAAKHASRLRSLTLIMTSSSNPRLRQPSLRVRLRMMKRPRALDRESLIRFGMDTWRVIGSPGHPASEEELREKVARQLDRNQHPRGFARQMLAIMASGSRVKLLPRIKTPTLVIHGADDPLVPVPAGRELAKLIPGAQLEVIPGMGHDLPRALLPKIEQLILHHAKHAERDHGPRPDQAGSRKTAQA